MQRPHHVGDVHNLPMPVSSGPGSKGISQPYCGRAPLVHLGRFKHGSGSFENYISM
jgi:hypothetical protein